MNIGGYALYPVAAGGFRLDGGAMFGVVPKVLWNRVHPADELNRIDMVSRSLLLAGEGRVVLVNTGMGTNWSSKERSIYALAPEVELCRSLAALGYAPEQVTHVILTHLHFDHAGGSTVPAASGSDSPPEAVEPAFPNAVYYLQREHLEWARHPSARDRASFRPEAWEPLVAAGQLELLDGPRELLPGVFLEVVHGHTPHQQLPRVSDGGSTLLFCSDLVPFASHVRVPWVMGYDLRPVDTVREKHDLLSRAAAEGWRLFLEHDPLYECCRVELTEKGFAAVGPGAL